MKIVSIQLKNFRQHQNLNLNLERQNADFVVIVGDNGFGKSNLLSAISWCLYGRESKAGKNLGYGSAPVNWHVASELSSGEACEVMAEVRVEVAGATAVIRRSQQYFKSASGEMIPRESEEFTIQELVFETKGYSSLTEPKDWIDRHFPERLEPYFLFDGERLDQFFRDENSALVERAIMQIAQVDRLESVNSRTETVRNELSREAARLSRNNAIKDAETKLEIAVSNYQTVFEQFQTHQESFEKIRARYLDAEKKVTQLASESSDRAKAAKVIKEHDFLTSALDGKWESFPSWALPSFTALLMSKASVIAKRIIEERRQNRTLPPKFDVEALEELLNQGSCICGREIIGHSDAANHISELVASYKDLSGSGRLLQELSPFVEMTIDSLSQAKTLTGEFRDSIAGLIDQIKNLEDKIPKAKPVEFDLNSDPTEQYLMWQDAHHEAQRRSGELETKRRDAEQRKEAAQAEFQRELRKDEQQRKQSDTIEFASRVLMATDAILSDWKGEVRAKVAEALEREFAPMLPKKRFIESVGIDEQFRVSVTVGTGDEAKDELSSGERQALAFAFSLGLNAISGYSLPMIIDTPFGRMGDEMKKNVATALSNNTLPNADRTSQQVIILMTDSEYSAEVASTLQSRKPSRYRISNPEGIRAELEAF